jgi:hypothetical protein
VCHWCHSLHLHHTHTHITHTSPHTSMARISPMAPMAHKLCHESIFRRNASNTYVNTHFSTYSLWLVKFHMGPTKFIRVPHDFVGPMWILINQRGCIEKCVLLAFLLEYMLPFYSSMSILLQQDVDRKNSIFKVLHDLYLRKMQFCFVVCCGVS